MSGLGWENGKVTDATSHYYFPKMETAALASPSVELWQFCRSHIIALKWNAEQSFLFALFIHDVWSFLRPKPTEMTHARVVTQSRTHCATASWGRIALIRVVGAPMRRWWVRVTPPGGTNMATEVVLRLRRVSTGGSPRKQHIFSMCNFYYYFHSRCTYRSTAEKKCLNRARHLVFLATQLGEKI